MVKPGLIGDYLKLIFAAQDASRAAQPRKTREILVESKLSSDRRVAGHSVILVSEVTARHAIGQHRQHDEGYAYPGSLLARLRV